jgi:hypothetical protein
MRSHGSSSFRLCSRRGGRRLLRSGGSIQKWRPLLPCSAPHAAGTSSGAGAYAHTGVMTDPNTAGIRRKRPGLAPKRELRDLAAAVQPLSGPLDLVHVTSVGAGREIVSLGQIEARPCVVFKRDLVYMFLARPAYRFRNGHAKSDQINRFPCAFVFRPDKLGPPFHIYPFDTGAGASGRYGDTVDPHVYLEDYELTPDLQAAQRHITWAFGGNRQYFEGDLSPGLMQGLHAWQSVGRGWLAIAGLAATGSNRPDKRASAIEIAYSKHLPLKGHARLAIFPQQLIEDDRGKHSAFIEALTKCGLPWETYDRRPNEAPDFFMDEVTRLVHRSLQDAGQL